MGIICTEHTQLMSVHTPVNFSDINKLAVISSIALYFCTQSSMKAEILSSVATAQTNIQDFNEQYIRISFNWR